MKNKKLPFAIATVLGVFALSSVANADLVIKTTATKTETPVPVKPVVKAPVASVVTATADPKVSGFGNDIPLEQAFQQMLPSPEWKVVWNGDDKQVAFLKAQKVSWNEKNVSLDQAVADLSKKTPKVDAFVDNTLKVISVKEVNSIPVASVASTAKSVAPISPAVFKSVPAYNPVTTVPVAQTPIVETWVLSPKMTLKENVEAWAKKAGYNVIWDGADYPIYGRTIFTGAFDSKDGPIVKVLSAYEHSDQPLKAQLTVRDHVLFVHNKNWDMPTVIPINSNDEVAPSITGHDAPAQIPNISRQAAENYNPYTDTQKYTGGKSVSQP